MNIPLRILVVDDEPSIRRLLATTLQRAGHAVHQAESAAAALAAARQRAMDVILLDLGLPGRDGLELIPVLKSSGAAIIVVSARDGTDHKVTALDLGASDYVTKPFDTEELLARIRSAQRGRTQPEIVPARVVAGELDIDLVRRQVRRGGQEIHLTPREYALLAELAKRAGSVVTHAHLLRSIWGIAHEHDVEYLRVAARSLRMKVEVNPSEPRFIRNEPGIGYRLMARPAE